MSNSFAIRILRCVLVLVAAVSAPGCMMGVESAPASTEARITKVEPAKAGLGDEITVWMSSLPKNKLPEEKWILFLDGVPLNGIYRENDDIESGKIRFYLRRSDTSTESWQKLLRGWKWTRPCTVAWGRSGAASTEAWRRRKDSSSWSWFLGAGRFGAPSCLYSRSPSP